MAGIETVYDERNTLLAEREKLRRINATLLEALEDSASSLHFGLKHTKRESDTMHLDWKTCHWRDCQKAQAAIAAAKP